MSCVEGDAWRRRRAREMGRQVKEMVVVEKQDAFVVVAKAVEFGLKLCGLVEL